MLIISVVDDSPGDAAALRALIDNYCRSSGTAYLLRTYSGSTEFIRSNDDSDIIFMEMQLSRMDGLETARLLRRLGSEAQLIYVTHRVDLAIRGYEVDAVDFLGKPASQAAVDAALEKAQRRIRRSAGVTLALKLPNGTAGVSSNDIMYVEVFDHNLVYHTLKGDFNVRGKLSDVRQQLGSERFILCNRSFIVNLRFVSGIYSDYVMVDTTKITVSKSHRREIMERFSAYLGQGHRAENGEPPSGRNNAR